MNRPWITALTGLALLAQSLSMAWASTRHAMPDPATSAEQAMPCHGQSNSASTDAGTAPDCCNGGCIFMCGGAPLPAPILALSTPTAGSHFPAAPVPALLASHTLSPFRPPAR